MPIGGEWAPRDVVAGYEPYQHAEARPTPGMTRTPLPVRFTPGMYGVSYREVCVRVCACVTVFLRVCVCVIAPGKAAAGGGGHSSCQRQRSSHTSLASLCARVFAAQYGAAGRVADAARVRALGVAPPRKRFTLLNNISLY